MNLDELLQELRSQGERESSGTFSLHWGQAARKLGQYQLSNPFHYVLRLVRCAVLSQASRIDITTNLEHTRVHFDSRLTWPEELERLLDHLLNSTVPVLQELAVASATALSTRPYRLELHVNDGRRGACLRTGREGEELVAASDQPPGTTFILHRLKPRRGWLAGLTRHFNAYSPEAKILLRRCAFCPIPLRVNGTRFNRPQEFGSPRLGPLIPAGHLIVEARYAQPGPNLVALPAVSQASRCWGEEHRLVGCAIGLCHGRPEHFRPGQNDDFLFVHGGVALYREELGVGHGPLLGILSCDGLTMDLSGDRVVRDQFFQTRLEWLRAHAAWLVRYVKKP